jgi:hypothetical protein
LALLRERLSVEQALLCRSEHERASLIALLASGKRPPPPPRKVNGSARDIAVRHDATGIKPGRTRRQHRRQGPPALEVYKFGALRLRVKILFPACMSGRASLCGLCAPIRAAGALCAQSGWRGEWRRRGAKIGMHSLYKLLGPWVFSVTLPSECGTICAPLPLRGIFDSSGDSSEAFGELRLGARVCGCVRVTD